MIASPADLAPIHRPYKPYGAARDLLYCRATEVLLSGPAGTGKSRACMEKAHLCAEKYPGCRILFVRKTRESMSESCLVTWEEKVVPEGHHILEGPKRNYRQSYYYPNGSQVVVAGMDKPSKAMSTEYDLIYVQEAIELIEDEWEKLTTRLRNGVMPYQQIMADTNPDRPGHWLKKRCDSGQTVMLDSRHEDNPTVTPEYLAKLDALTGPRKDRLRWGRWVQAEGVVYEGWNRSVHVIDRETFTRLVNPDKGGARATVAGVDWGFRHPGVIVVGQTDGDGRLYVVREIYRTGQTIDWWIEIAKLLRNEYGVREFACDPSEPAYIEQFIRAGLRATQAKNAILPGISKVKERLIVQPDGRPRLYFLSDCLAERDMALDEAKKPCCAFDEFDSYVYKLDGGRRKGEEPEDADNHAMDAARYLVAAFDLNDRVRLQLL